MIADALLYLLILIGLGAVPMVIFAILLGGARSCQRGPSRVVRRINETAPRPSAEKR